MIRYSEMVSLPVVPCETFLVPSALTKLLLKFSNFSSFRRSACTCLQVACTFHITWYTWLLWNMGLCFVDLLSSYPFAHKVRSGETTAWKGKIHINHCIFITVCSNYYGLPLWQNSCISMIMLLQCAIWQVCHKQNALKIWR